MGTQRRSGNPVHAATHPYDPRMAVGGDLSTERHTGRSGKAVRGWLVARLAVLVLVLGLIATVAAVGRAPGELDQLSGALSAHQLGELTVVGNGLPSNATGCATQQVVWRERGLLRSVHLLVQRGDVGGCSIGTTEALDPAITDAAVWVRRLDSGVTIQREPWPSANGVIGRWTVPSALVSAFVFVGLAWLYLLVAGPEPWRATRWAWFWLGGSLVGAVAFLLVSGPTPGIPAPRPRRRLTGGRGLLLAVVLAAMGPTWLALSG